MKGVEETDEKVNEENKQQKLNKQKTVAGSSTNHGTNEGLNLLKDSEEALPKCCHRCCNHTIPVELHPLVPAPREAAAMARSHHHLNGISFCNIM